MNNIRSPSQFANGFNYSFAEEDRTLIVVFIEFILLIVENRLAMEIVFVVNKINLELCIRNRRNFNDQWLFFVTNRNVYP